MANTLQLHTPERVVILTGPRDSDPSDPRSSICCVADRVRELLVNIDDLACKKEVVIAGGWNFSKDTMSALEAQYGKLDLESAIDTETDEPVRSGDLTRARSQSSAAKNTLKKHELEWSLAINLIKTILDKIKGLHSLEWETDLPFSQELWAVIPDTIQKLNLNLFVPDAETRDVHEPHPDYFAHDDLKHVTSFEHLKILRVYNMVDSFQPFLWEAVWKNPGLVTLELGMKDKPITRDSDNGGKPMPVIDRNWEYHPERVATDTYRGREGDGMLHHQYGHGEYLDRVAISKARNAVMHTVGELQSMPVTTLRLANFVVDDTSFVKFFNNLGTIVFCDSCVDAGFVLPKHLNGKVRIFTRANGLGELIEGPEDEEEARTVIQTDS
ncbi:hypothetical protein GTA08_BOTSDO12955 [Neofusicoccum parvum]|uniref:Uncharacterized protein n=1 Tax=Neofusicoccum parvum TaxID=310453 RepID=A0ACB5S712_9PEZI|nr:hypothetical protein GTA08_BOTSDO12955 [Neofusicoccum parvum]